MRVRVFRKDPRKHTLIIEGVHLHFIEGKAEVRVSHEVGCSLVCALRKREDVEYTVC